MQIQNTNNNNVSFGAYFKNNNLFKQLYTGELRRVDAELVDKFTKECPDHEIEIVSESPSVLYKGTKQYNVFNNTTGAIYPVYTNIIKRPLDAIMDSLIQLKAFDTAGFWKNEQEHSYNALIGRNKKV